MGVAGSFLERGDQWEIFIKFRRTTVLGGKEGVGLKFLEDAG
jgi:hypothetical protein